MRGQLDICFNSFLGKAMEECIEHGRLGACQLDHVIVGVDLLIGFVFKYSKYTMSPYL